MYAQQPQGNNLLTAMQGFQGLANAGAQNDLMRQGLINARSQNALIGQETANAGEQNKILQQSQQLQRLNITQQQAQTHLQRLGLVGQKLAEVYGTDGGQPTSKHIIDGVSELIAHNPGVFDKDFAAQALSDIPSEADVAKNPNAVKQWLIAKASVTDQARAALEPLMPQGQAVDYGQGKVVIDANAKTNPGLIGTRVQNGLSPADAASEAVIGYDAQGNPVRGTKQQFVTRAQGGNPNPGGGAVAPGTVTPGGGSVAANPGPIDEVMGAANPQAAQAATARLGAMAAPQGSPAGIPVPSGSAEANAALAGASAQQAAGLQNAIARSQERKAMLSNLEDLSAKFTGGPMAAAKNKAIGTFNEFTHGAINIHPEAVASQEEFKKIATQLAQEQYASMGGTGSSEHLASAMASNPNEALSNSGTRKIVQMLKGSEDALAAKNDAWTAYKKQHGGAASYGDFQTGFNQTFEPRAYQLQHMTPAERTEMFHGMTINERKSVLDAAAAIRARGGLKPGQEAFTGNEGAK